MLWAEKHFVKWLCYIALTEETKIYRPLKFNMSLLFVFVWCRIVPLFVESNSILLSNILSFFYPCLLPSFIPLSKIGALSQAFCRNATFLFFPHGWILLHAVKLSGWQLAVL